MVTQREAETSPAVRGRLPAARAGASASSRIRRSATAARSAAASPTPIRRPSCRRSVAASRRLRARPRRRRRADDRRRGVLPALPDDGARAGRGAHRRRAAGRERGRVGLPRDHPPSRRLPAVPVRRAGRARRRRCADVRLVLYGVADRPVRARAAEELAPRRAGAAPSRRPPRPRPATGLARGDLHASPAYRRHLAEVLARRSLEAAIDGRAHVPERDSGSPSTASPMTGEVPARMTLADFLREELDLTATHLGCEHGVCGACTVHVDGHTARVLHHARRPGRRLRGHDRGRPRAQDGAAHRRSSRAFWEKHGMQCGFCTPGFLMTVTELLRRAPGPVRRADRARRSAATCAAAPATRRSSRPCTRPSGCAGGSDEREGRRPEARRRERQAQGGPAAAARRRALRRRPQAGRAPARRRAAQPGRARADPRWTSTPCAPTRAPGSCSPPRTFRTGMPPLPCIDAMPDTKPREPAAARDATSCATSASRSPFVVAESRPDAEDLLELIDVDYEPLPAVVDPERAATAGRADPAPGLGHERRQRAHAVRRRRRRGLRRGGARLRGAPADPALPRDAARDARRARRLGPAARAPHAVVLDAVPARAQAVRDRDARLCRRIRCASWRRTSAAASASRASSIPRRSCSASPRAAWGAR